MSDQVLRRHTSMEALDCSCARTVTSDEVSVRHKKHHATAIVDHDASEWLNDVWLS